MRLQFVNVKSEPIGAPTILKGSRRRFDKVVAKATEGLDAPFMASLHSPGQALVCTEETLRIRPMAIPKGLSPAVRKEWESRLWRNTIVAKDQTVLITILPQGGGQGGAGKIALTIASIALMAFAGPLASLALKGSLLAGNVWATAAIQAGIAIGGHAHIEPGDAS